jgi:8-oxo-dGTP pyrophosphatase MutT (NUDIX family)
MLDVIDNNDKVLYSATREEVYANRLPHRIVHILVKKGDSIFIQQRAENVRYLPGYYCTSAGGHVEAGETPIEAAQRELKEELGLETKLEMIGNFIFDDGHKRNIFLYQTILQGEMVMNPLEVSGGIFVNQEEFSKLPTDKLHPQLLPCLKYVWPSLTDNKEVKVEREI